LEISAKDSSIFMSKEKLASIDWCCRSDKIEFIFYHTLENRYEVQIQMRYLTAVSAVSGDH
jgi:hypothetical protein